MPKRNCVAVVIVAVARIVVVVVALVCVLVVVALVTVVVVVVIVPRFVVRTILLRSDRTILFHSRIDGAEREACIAFPIPRHSALFRAMEQAVRSAPQQNIQRSC